jgi:hypothetical protein
MACIANQGEYKAPVRVMVAICAHCIRINVLTGVNHCLLPFSCFFCYGL